MPTFFPCIGGLSSLNGFLSGVSIKEDAAFFPVET
jgi:hypothetical protein